MKATGGSRRPRVIDLFAGCGGMTRGFLDSGYEPVLAVEFDLAAAATYASNFGEQHTRWLAIEDLEIDQLVDAEVVAGGPPCQGFSNLGKRQSADARNGYWSEFVDVVNAVQPQVFVLENVGRFLKSHQFASLRCETRAGGRLAGYSIEPHLLNAADYGVAQRRQRAIVIGSRVGEIGAPAPTHSKEPALGLEKWRTVRSEIKDLDVVPAERLPDSTTEYFGEHVEGEFKAPDIHVGRTYQLLSLARFEHIPPGGNRMDIPEELLYECWRRHKRGSTDVMGRLRWDEPALTIRTEFFKPDKGRYLHPQWDERLQVNRALTHLEAARLQSFEDDFLWCGRKIEIARQIGNAVPPRLAGAIARHLLRHLS